jgi:hypothetical protein
MIIRIISAFKVAPFVSNQAQIITPIPTIPINNNNSLGARYSEFAGDINRNKIRK